MNRALVGTLIAVGLIALQAVAMALVDGTIALPPAYAWIASVAAAILAALQGYKLPTPPNSENEGE